MFWTRLGEIRMGEEVGKGRRWVLRDARGANVRREDE